MVLSSRELAAYTQHRKEAMKIVSFLFLHHSSEQELWWWWGGEKGIFSIN